MDPKVAIIIPVYNAKKFMKDCLKNCINQTFEDLEIIVVDDKSTDNTVEIVQSVMKEDDRIRLIQLEENRRQGYARNVAVEQAKADYVMFLDVDDAYRDNCVEEMYNKITADDADMTICKFDTVDDETGLINQNQADLQLYTNFAYVDKKYHDGFNYKDLPNSEIFNKANVIWDKIYKKSFLLDNNIKFPAGMFCEDDVFSFTTIFKAKKITVLDKSLIFYRINRVDSSSNLQDRTGFDCFRMYELVRNLLWELNIYYKYQYDFMMFQLYSFLFFYKYVNPKYKKEFFYKMKKELMAYIGVLDCKSYKDRDAYFYDMLEIILKNNYYLFEIKKHFVNKKYGK